MTDQTGNDRYAGTSPPPRESQPEADVRPGTMTQTQQTGTRMQSQSSGTGSAGKGSSDRGPGETKQSEPKASEQGAPMRDAPAKDAPESSDQYELNTPDTMPHDEDDEVRRKQAGAQSDHSSDDLPRDGFGYGAEDGETMADAPDASERGYGGGAERRKEKVDGED